MDIEFEVVPSHVEELVDGYDFIPDLCEANAGIKAEARPQPPNPLTCTTRTPYS